MASQDPAETPGDARRLSEGNLRHADGEVTDAAPAHVPHFRPFFTVVDDRTTGEHHHPHVHYLFSDDEQDILTNAILQAHEIDKSDSAASDQDENKPGRILTSNQERLLVVDLADDGQSIQSVKSLSPEWQVIRSDLTAAPTFGDGPSANEAGTMMRIEGLEGRSNIAASQNIQQTLAQATDIRGPDGRPDVMRAIAALSEDYRNEMETLIHWSSRSPKPA